MWTSSNKNKTNVESRPNGTQSENAIGAGWWLAFGIGVGIALLVSLPPVLSPAGRKILMGLFSNACHQLPTRSPNIAGVQLAVCHRCLGIYYAFPIAAVLFKGMRGRWPAKSHWAAIILLLAVAPSAVDWAGDVIGLWTNTPASRMTTGAILGLAAGYFLAKACSEIVNDYRRSGSKQRESRRR